MWEYRYAMTDYWRAASVALSQQFEEKAHEIFIHEMGGVSRKYFMDSEYYEDENRVVLNYEHCKKKAPAVLARRINQITCEVDFDTGAAAVASVKFPDGWKFRLAVDTGVSTVKQLKAEICDAAAKSNFMYSRNTIINIKGHEDKPPQCRVVSLVKPVKKAVLKKPASNAA